MTAASLGKFLMVCAFASDLYCPAYVGGTLTKDSNLAKEAVHYKINADRMLCELKDKIARKSAKPKNPKLQASAKPKASAKKR